MPRRRTPRCRCDAYGVCIECGEIVRRRQEAARRIRDNTLREAVVGASLVDGDLVDDHKDQP